MVNDYIEKTMVYCVQQQNIIIQSLFLSKHFPTDRSSRLSRHNHESAKAFSRSPVNFRGHGLCSLKCYDLFVATDNICAQRGTALNYECRVQVINFQIFSFVYHFIRLWREILHYSTAVNCEQNGLSETN